jgi:hypothetical protein
VDTWGKANTITTLIAVIVMTIILAYIGNIYIQTEKDKDVHRYVIDIALNVLGQEPNKDNIDARKWAINTINFYSTVRIHRAAQEELLHKIKLDRSFNPVLLESVCKDLQKSMRN